MEKLTEVIKKLYFGIGNFADRYRRVSANKISAKSFLGGYSLTELSISTAIIAILAVGGLSLLAKKNEADNVRKTYNNIATIENSIRAFIRIKGYIPCPALPALLESNVNFGKSEGMTTGGAITSTVNYAAALNATSYDGTHKCNQNGLTNETGAVPVRTLGIPDSMAYDGWGRKFMFRTASASGNNIDYNNPSFRGNIAITDLKGTNKTNISEPPPYNEGAIYVIISYGPDGKDVAYRRNDATAPSAATGYEVRNTNHSSNTYIQSDKTANFDDIVAFGTNAKLGRQKVAETPIRIQDISCDNAQVLSKLGRSNTNFNNYATAGSYSSNADAIYKSATIVGNLCQNNKRGETWGPLNVAKLTLWLDANDSATLFTNSNCTAGGNPANAASIGCWRDKSGLNNNATQTTGANQPTYSTSDSAFNNKPAVVMESQHYLTGPGITLRDATFFFVAKSRSVIANDNLAFFGLWDSSVSTDYETQNSFVFSESRNSGSSTIRRYTGGMVPGGNWSNCIWMDFDTSHQTNVPVIIATTINQSGQLANSLQNATSSGTTDNSFPQGNIASTGYLINERLGKGPDGGIHDYAEILIYNQALSTLDRDKIHEYLSTKWGIPLSTSTSTCEPGMVFQKTADSPQGRCQCPAGQVYISDLSTVNACNVPADNSTFGKCVTRLTAPNYTTLYQSTPTVATRPDIGGMVLWLDANDCTTVTIEPITASHTTTTVNKWSDKSGQGNDAVQATVANQPAYVTSVINSSPVMRFDGTASHMISPLNINYTVLPNMTAFTVFQNQSGGGAIQALWGNDNGSWDRYICTQHSTSTEIGVGKGSLGAGAQPIGISSFTTPMIISNTWQSAVSAGSQAWGNSAAYSVFTESHSNSGDSSLSIGTMGSNSSYGYRAKADIAEIIIYNKALTSKERDDVEKYLSVKYDIVRDPSHKTTQTDIASAVKLWLDASDGSTVFNNSSCNIAATDGGSVNCWRDKSGRNDNALPVPYGATNPISPVYSLNNLNGKPGIFFEGSHSMLSTFNTQSTFTTNVVVFTVANIYSGNGAIVYESSQGGVNDWGSSFRVLLGTDIEWSLGNIVANSAGFTSSWATPPAPTTASQYNTPYVWTFEEQTSPVKEIRRNGAFYDSDARSTPNAAAFDTGIGGHAGVNTFYNGTINELIIYTKASVLTPAQRLNIERYLGAKWGITVQ